VFHRNYSCKYGYTSGLKTGATKFLADDPLGWGNCQYLNLTILSTPHDFLYSVLLKCTRCLAIISHNEVLSLNAYPHSVDIKIGFWHNQPHVECVSEALSLTHKIGRVSRLRMTDAVAPLSHTCLQSMHMDNFIFENLNFMSL
jgi:hypothetical protein